MVNIYTSKRFLNNKKLIRDTTEFLKDTVYKNDDKNVMEKVNDLLLEFRITPDGRETDIENMNDVVKCSVCILYDSLTDKNHIFDIGELTDNEITEVLKYTDRFNGHIFCIRTSRALIYSSYEFIANNEMLFSGGNSLGNYLMLRNLSNGHKNIKTEENKEVIIRGNGCLYSFELKDRTQLILFDTDIEKEQFIKSVLYAVKNKGCNTIYVFPVTDKTIKVYDKFLTMIDDSDDIIRIVDIDTVDYKKFIDDNVRGLVVYVATKTRFNYNTTKEKICSVDEFNSLKDGKLSSKISSADCIMSDGEFYYAYTYSEKENKDFCSKVPNISDVKRDIIFLPEFDVSVYNI